MRTFSRRALLKATACVVPLLSTTPETWASSPGASNTFDDLIEHAEKTAKHRYIKTIEPLPAPFAHLNYDSYRRLRPRGEQTIWLNRQHSYGVLPPSPRLYLSGWNRSVAACRQGQPPTERRQPLLRFRRLRRDQRQGSRAPWHIRVAPIASDIFRPDAGSGRVPGRRLFSRRRREPVFTDSPPAACRSTRAARRNFPHSQNSKCSPLRILRTG